MKIEQIKRLRRTVNLDGSEKTMNSEKFAKSWTPRRNSDATQTTVGFVKRRFLSSEKRGSIAAGRTQENARAAR